MSVTTIVLTRLTYFLASNFDTTTILFHCMTHHLDGITVALTGLRHDALFAEFALHSHDVTTLESTSAKVARLQIITLVTEGARRMEVLGTHVLTTVALFGGRHVDLMK